MTMVLRTPSAAQSFASPARAWSPGTVLSGLWAAYTIWRDKRLAMARLHAMSDRQLRDIGITRSEIEFAVGGERERDDTVGRGF
jgi:uncharacterized protein YjiS (DUF1127 family)